MSNVNNCSIFVTKQKCIVNTDLDGILSGIILQNFLQWEIVGFSSCAGKPEDEIWLKDKNINLQECIFVDLPVAQKNIATIDQHFVALNEDSVKRYNSCENKINPNILRNRCYINKNGQSDYTSKYPFGTFHFIIACLERKNLIPTDYKFELYKKIENFDLVDLILRADRVIGNTKQYTTNCIDWCNWMIDFGGNQTKNIFNVVKNEFNKRYDNEIYVQNKLKALGCVRADGDCSNMLRNKNYKELKIYFKFLSDCLNLETLPIFNVLEYGKLYGNRIEINNQNINFIREELIKNKIFSYAFVTLKTLSITYIDKKGETDE